MTTSRRPVNLLSSTLPQGIEKGSPKLVHASYCKMASRHIVLSLLNALITQQQMSDTQEVYKCTLRYYLIFGNSHQEAYV